MQLTRPKYVNHRRWADWEAIIMAHDKYFSQINDIVRLESEILDLWTAINGISKETAIETFWEVAKQLNITH